MSEPIRVFIIEQDAPALLMLTLWLQQFDDVEVVGTALARSGTLNLIEDANPDVVIYNWPSTSRALPALVRQLRSSENSPALVCIRNGNFLPLECTQNTTPEAILPSTGSANDLLEAIQRSARKLRIADIAGHDLPKAG